MLKRSSHLLCCIVLILFTVTGLDAAIYRYVIDRNEDDGMELNDVAWMEDGLQGAEPNIYLGRLNHNYADGGLRFHLEDRLQGERFTLARLRLTAAASNVPSQIQVRIRGVDQDSPAGFSQLNRPSHQSPLTAAVPDWDITGWVVQEFQYSETLIHALYVYSPDISSIVNQILERPLWGTGPEGKVIMLLLDNNSPFSGEEKYVAFEDFWDGNGRPAILELFESPVETFVGGPVLSRPTASGVTITLVPQMATDFYVEFGSAPGAYTGAIGMSQTILPAVDAVMGLEAWLNKELEISGLSPGTTYYYRLRARKSGDDGLYDAGPEQSFTTPRPPGETFHFALLSDSHVGVEWTLFTERWDMGERTIQNAIAGDPDFFIVGGDEACTDMSSSLTFYDALLRYAQACNYYGPLAQTAPIFMVLGNHEGEGSYQDADLIRNSRQARKIFFSNPTATTYSYGGGSKENYFAWEWGDALFIVLDCFSYTGTENPGSIEPYGSAWDLGETQLAWLETVLSTSGARWKLVFAHHIMASYERSGYGRGGAKYAHDWQQGVIHQMMLDYGAQIFFYGHDHVFADGRADGIHYNLCAQAFGTGVPIWARNIEGNPVYPYFLAAYPYGWFNDKGYTRVRVEPKSVWVDFIRSSLDDELNGDVIYSYHLADVTVDLIHPPTTGLPGETIPLFPGFPEFAQDPDTEADLSGETLEFSAVFTNHTNKTQSFDFRVWIQFDGGEELYLDSGLDTLLGPKGDKSARFEGVENQLIRHYRVHLPKQAGTYMVTAETGNYPSVLMSRDAFGGDTN